MPPFSCLACDPCSPARGWSTAGRSRKGVTMRGRTSNLARRLIIPMKTCHSRIPFFCLSDWSPVSHSLSGSASPPFPSETMSFAMCKTLTFARASRQIHFLAQWWITFNLLKPRGSASWLYCINCTSTQHLALPERRVPRLGKRGAPASTCKPADFQVF